MENYYVRQVLRYNTPLLYRGEIYDLIYADGETWDFKHGNNVQVLNVAPDLAQAMTYNPRLKVFSAQRILRFRDAVLRDRLYAQSSLSRSRRYSETSPTASTNRGTWSISTPARWRGFTTIWNAGMRKYSRIAERLALVALAAALIGAAPPEPKPSATPNAAVPDAVTHSTISLGGHAYPYTARAGTIALQNDKGETTCRMFYTAFTVDGADPRTRPVTFLYNGGPGSSTIWLRMGSFGPMRVQVGDGTSTASAPFNLVENQYSLLDRTDLVFIDAPDTGFSRIVGAGKPSDFFGVDPDVRAFAQFISRYISTFGRWNSPKFLFGESYGTPRSAVLVAYLQKQGIGINGVVLLSSVLDFGLDWDVNFTPTAIGGGDWAFPLYLPTQAAAAWYHHALPGPQTTLDALLPQVESFAMGEYLNALAQGAKLSPATYDDVVAKLHQYTGLSERYIRDSNLRVPYWRFQTELFRNSGVMTGRYDARYTSFMLDRINDRADFDPTDSAIDAAFVATGNYFMRQVLGYHTDMIYRPTINVFQQWDWKHDGNLPTNTAQDLAGAMVFDPEPARLLGERLLRFCDAVLRDRLYAQSHEPAAGAAEEHHLRLLRIRSHGLSAPRSAGEVPRRPRALVRSDAAGRPIDGVSHIGCGPKTEVGSGGRQSILSGSARVVLPAAYRVIPL